MINRNLITPPVSWITLAQDPTTATTYGWYDCSNVTTLTFGNIQPKYLLNFKSKVYSFVGGVYDNKYWFFLSFWRPYIAYQTIEVYFDNIKYVFSSYQYSGYRVQITKAVYDKYKAKIGQKVKYQFIKSY